MLGSDGRQTLNRDGNPCISASREASWHIGWSHLAGKRAFDRGDERASWPVLMSLNIVDAATVLQQDKPCVWISNIGWGWVIAASERWTLLAVSLGQKQRFDCFSFVF